MQINSLKFIVINSIKEKCIYNYILHMQINSFKFIVINILLPFSTCFKNMVYFTGIVHN